MKTRAALRTSTLAARDLARFLDRHYLAAKIGDILHRSLRRRMSQAALAAAAGFAGARLSAVGGAGPVAALAIVCGLLAWGLQLWATRALAARLAYARSHGAFLLKDRKKAALLDDLPRLWRRVYAAEIPIAFPDPETRRNYRLDIRELERAATGSAPESRRFDFGLRLSHARLGCALLSARAFRAAVEYELYTSHPQNTQDARLGFSLTLLEDALDAATLGHTDESGFERQAAHASLIEAEQALARHTPLPGRWRLAVEGAARRRVQAFWRRNAALALEARTGALLRRLHDRYRTARIDVQDLLWRDEEALLALSLAIADDHDNRPPETFPVADAVRREARAEARRVFSTDPDTIARVVRRMHGHDLIRAVFLLAAGDPDYALACGSGITPDSPTHGPCDPLLDLAAAGATAHDRRRLHALARDAADAAAYWPTACEQACRSTAAFHQACPSPEARRAARLAWHTDDRGLRRGVLSGRLHGPALEARLHAVADGCKQATERLRTLRLRRELAAWELDYALAYALTLCGFDGTAYHAPAFPVPVPG